MTDGRLSAGGLGRRPAGMTRPRRLNDTRRYGVAGRRMCIQKLLQLEPHGRDDERARFGVVELFLRLTLKLRIDHEQVDDADQPLADVVRRDLQLGRHQVVRLHVRSDGTSDGVT
jgi:hypothetical protein